MLMHLLKRSPHLLIWHARKAIKSWQNNNRKANFAGNVVNSCIFYNRVVWCIEICRILMFTSDIRGRISHLVVPEPVPRTPEMWPIFSVCIILPYGTTKFAEFHRLFISYQISNWNQHCPLGGPGTGSEDLGHVINSWIVYEHTVRNIEICRILMRIYQLSCRISKAGFATSWFQTGFRTFRKCDQFWHFIWPSRVAHQNLQNFIKKIISFKTY